MGSLAAASQSKIAVSAEDYLIAAGSLKGTLTYLDYSSGRSFSMPANVILARNPADRNAVIFSFDYPEERKANGNDTLVISNNGLVVNGATVTSKTKLADGSLQIITDKEGKDGNDNKKAILRHIYTISKDRFVNRKEVKFDGTDSWILRNEFSFRR